MSQLNCTNKIADCNQNELAVNNTCYQYSASNNNSGTVFEFSNNETEGNIIGTDTNINLHECAVKCYQNPNCSAIRFNISPEDSDGGLLSEGDCYYYGYNLESKNTLPSWPDKCSSIYTKNIVDNSNKVSIGPIVIDLNTARTSDSQSQVKTKYSGSVCRRKIADDATGNIYDFQTIQDMSDWCSKNQNVDSCKNFCDNDAYTNNYCPWKSKITKITYILIGIWFLLVFLMVYLYIRAETIIKKKYIIFSFSIILIGILIYIVYNIGVVFGYFKGSTQKDYSSNIINISGSGTCDSSSNGLSCKPFGDVGCINQPEYLYYGIPYYFKSVNQRDSNGNKVGYCGGLLPPEGYIGQQINPGQTNQGCFNILDTTTDESNPPGIFMIYQGDGTLPPTDIPVPVLNGDSILLQNVSNNKFFAIDLGDITMCWAEDGGTPDKGLAIGKFAVLTSVTGRDIRPPNTSDTGVYYLNEMNITSKSNSPYIPLNNFSFSVNYSVYATDPNNNQTILTPRGTVFVSCDPSSDSLNSFLVDILGNNNNSDYSCAHVHNDDDADDYLYQQKDGICPSPGNRTAFPSTSCTSTTDCTGTITFSNFNYYPASVWVFSAEKVNSS